MSGRGREMEILKVKELQYKSLKPTRPYGTTCCGHLTNNSSPSQVQVSSDGAQNIFSDDIIKLNTSQTFGPN